MEKYKNLEMITDNPHLNLYEMDAVKRNGDEFKYYFASRGRGSKLKALTKENTPEGVAVYGIYGEKYDKIVLVRQYRYPINDYVYELPAGLVEKEEDLENTGIREFKEETGLTLTLYKGGDAAYRNPFYTTVGITDESVAVVYGYASGKPSGEGLEDSEDLKTIIADREEVRRILREEKVAIKCAFLLMQFINAKKGEPFGFLE